MTSLYFCVACYWAVRAGAKGPLDKFARKPGLRSDKYQQHLDRILGHKGLDDKIMDLDVPSCTKKSLGREIRKIAVSPAHELLDEEVLNTSSMTDVIAASVRDNEWPPLYTNHVVALQARARAMKSDQSSPSSSMWTEFLTPPQTQWWGFGHTMPPQRFAICSLC